MSKQFTETQMLLVEKFNQRQPIEGITHVVTHPSCHLDEFGALYLLQSTVEGQMLFPGIQDADLGFVTETYLREKGYMGFNGFIKALENGYLIIGLGGGPFDEHSDRNKKVSCLELVKRYLDLFKKSENRDLYGSLVQFINYEDNNGDNLIQNMNKTMNGTLLTKDTVDALRSLNVGMIAQHIKKAWEVIETTEEMTGLANFVFKFFDTEIRQRAQFLSARREFQNMEKIIERIGAGHCLVVTESNNKQILKVARAQTEYPGGLKLGVALNVNSQGQFCIIPSNGFKDKMFEVVKILRQKVAFARSDSGKGLPFDELGRAGSIWRVPEIYIDENTGIIMNGSKTDPDVPGLIGKEICLDDLIDAVLIVCNKWFDFKNSDQCSNGSCPKVAKNENCSLFCFNLIHCQTVREEMLKS